MKANKLYVLAKILGFSDEETFLLFDLAAKVRKELPPDIAIYLQGNELARQAVREAANKNVPDKVWKDFIASIAKEVNDNAGNEIPMP